MLLLHVRKVNNLQKFSVDVFFCQQLLLGNISSRLNIALYVVVLAPFSAFTLAISLVPLS
jgi:hypothetical protein